MKTKTPQFDLAIKEILNNLVPHKVICKWQGKHKYCEDEFEITKEDIEFLKMFKVPAPQFCPTCRSMRRFIHMNQVRYSKIKCNAEGHDEMIISQFPRECPFGVVDWEYYISDDFEPAEFEYDENESPLAQFFMLRKKVPMPSFLNRDSSCINSDYSSGGRNLKNGYHCSGCFSSEDIWYSGLVHESREIMDSTSIKASDMVYGSIQGNKIYKSAFVFFTRDTSDCMFMYDCRNCSDCFGCVNLRNKRFCVWNKQLTREEYEEFMKSVYPLTHDKLEEYKEKFWELVKSLPMNATRNTMSVNYTGTNIDESKDIQGSIEVYKSENLRYCYGALHMSDSMDVLYSGGHSDYLYQTCNVGSQSHNSKYSVSTKTAIDCEFVFNCRHVTNCFMCVGIEDKKFCILNKQYREEEYFNLVDKIKCALLVRGEYNDCVGFNFSAQAYNFSNAQLYFPLSNEEIVNLGGYVASDQLTNVGDMEILLKDEIPQTIVEVTDDILDKAIMCTVTGRPFRITETELIFLRKMKLPLPRIHPVARIESRYKFYSIGKNYKVTCANCHKNILSMFSPDESYILYCEDCYNREVL